jgi:hypothetical protein
MVTRLPRFVSLGEIRAEPSLADMPLLKKGMRLSVQPVTEAQYRRIVAMADEPAPPEPPPKPKAPKKPAKKSNKARAKRSSKPTTKSASKKSAKKTKKR